MVCVSCRRGHRPEADESDRGMTVDGRLTVALASITILQLTSIRPRAADLAGRVDLHHRLLAAEQHALEWAREDGYQAQCANARADFLGPRLPVFTADGYRSRGW